MTTDEKTGSGNGTDLVGQIKSNFATMGIHDKVVLFGCGAFVLLSFFNWISNDFDGINGWRGIHILGNLAVVGAVVVTLLKVSEPKWLQAALAGGGFLIGPLAYWISYDVPDAEAMSGVSKAAAAMADKYVLSYTLVFWIGLLASLAGAAAAGVKLFGEK